LASSAGDYSPQSVLNLGQGLRSEVNSGISVQRPIPLHLTCGVFCLWADIPSPASPRHTCPRPPKPKTL